MIELKDHLADRHLPQLMELFAGQWWTASRDIGDVATMLKASDLVFALFDGAEDRLVGFARVITDGIYLAMVLDVIVAADRRGQRLGAMLMDAIVTR